ncbi:MAG: hypothetical protein LBS53_09600 [Synergistaceae bacterium]|jgi:hypothetical protein|nr:hypothetical protein [Synergistaceae bacterium]
MNMAVFDLETNGSAGLSALSASSIVYDGAEHELKEEAIVTFHDLLLKHPIDELWYILSRLDSSYGKPVQAERVYHGYTRAREELLSLHGVSHEQTGELVCTLEIDKDYGGAPETGMRCSWRKIAETDDPYLDILDIKAGDLACYGFEFEPWAEIIDLPVARESIDQYGELVCTAELLWETTWNGFSAACVQEKTNELVRSGDETRLARESRDQSVSHPFEPDGYEYAPNPKELAAVVAGWFRDAPDLVKAKIRDIVTFNAASDSGEDMDLPRIIERLEKAVSESTCEYKQYKGREDAFDLLHAMIRGLDDDEMLTLLRVVA